AGGPKDPGRKPGDNPLRAVGEEDRRRRNELDAPGRYTRSRLLRSGFAIDTAAKRRAGGYLHVVADRVRGEGCDGAGRGAVSGGEVEGTGVGNKAQTGPGSDAT